MNPNQPQSIDHAELARKSEDRIRVNNPTNEDYVTYWDGFGFKIPSMGSVVLPRYLADKYLQEMANKIIMQNADKAVKAENDRRVKAGIAKMDPSFRSGEQLAFESPFYANWPEKIKDTIREYALFGGVEERFGNQTVAPLSRKPVVEDPNASISDNLAIPQDTRPVKELDALPIAPSVGSVTEDLEKKDVFTLRKIAREQGLSPEKTATKADLLAQIKA